MAVRDRPIEQLPEAEAHKEQAQGILHHRIGHAELIGQCGHGRQIGIDRQGCNCGQQAQHADHQHVLATRLPAARIARDIGHSILRQINTDRRLRPVGRYRPGCCAARRIKAGVLCQPLRSTAIASPAASLGCRPVSVAPGGISTASV